MKDYYLFLDDLRVVKDVTWINLPEQDWKIVRSYDEFIKFIEKNGVPAFVAFDHDLGPQSYIMYSWANSPLNPNKGIFEYDKFKEMTGFHCAKWLVEYCLDKGEKIPDYVAHTMNNIGKENIISIMEQGKRVQDSL